MKARSRALYSSLRDFFWTYSRGLDNLIDEIREFGEPLQLKEHVERICSVLSCHLSIRGGQQLSLKEMNDFLRQVEESSYSGQCNHGRPTYVSLKKRELEKIFKRKA